MAYDLEEQEQIDEFKAWWKTYGKYVLLAVAVVLFTFFGIQGWRYYQHRQALMASTQYETLSQADAKDLKLIRSISAELMDKFSGTAYAGRAALIVAKANYIANDSKSAKAQLDWARNNAQEEPIKAIAQLQLAAMQLEEKQYDEALKILAEKHDPGFDGLFADLKGDILAAQGKKTEAKAAYQDALSKLDDSGNYHHFTAHKLEALGS